MGIILSKILEKVIDSLRLAFKEFRSTTTSQVDSNSDCLVDVSLPQELITEILVHLPVKSLLKFKSVSKTWLSLITDPQFTRSHFSNSTSLELLFATDTRMTKCCLYSALHHPDPSMQVSAIEPPTEFRHSIVVGIINGLVCLNLKGTDLCIWNPALNKVMHLNVYPEALSNTVEYTFSFGYEESNDDYKAVCLQTVLVNDGLIPEVRVYNVCIYSLKADSWKTIYELKSFYLPDPGVFANGKIYWSSHLLRANPNGKIVSLDMSSEKFVEMQPPKYDAGECVSSMGVSGGQPFVLCVYNEVNKLDLWVLDKRGVEECWCKFVSFPYGELGHDVFWDNVRVLCISNNGDIVLGGKRSLIVYNYKKKESRSIDLADGITRSLGIAAYVESLVWPNYA